MPSPQKQVLKGLQKQFARGRIREICSSARVKAWHVEYKKSLALYFT